MTWREEYQAYDAENGHKDLRGEAHKTLAKETDPGFYLCMI